MTAAGTLQLGKIGAFTAFYPAMANTENHPGGAVLADRAPYSNETLRIRVHFGWAGLDVVGEKSPYHSLLDNLGGTFHDLAVVERGDFLACLPQL